MMTDWLTLLPDSDLKEGDQRALTVGNKPLLLIKHQHEIHALENNCPHQQLPLEGGEIADGNLICPFHGAQFCLKTGLVKSLPATENLRVFPVRVNAEGWIEICLERP